MKENTIHNAIKWLEAKLLVDREYLEPSEVKELETTINELKEMIDNG